MANFYTDNDDIRFLFRHYNLKTLAEIIEDGFTAGGKTSPKLEDSLEAATREECEWAPADADDAVENYDRVLEILGQVSGDTIEPNAEGIDLEDNQGRHINFFDLNFVAGDARQPEHIIDQSVHFVRRRADAVQEIFPLVIQ